MKIMLERDFGDVALLDLSAAAGGSTLFVREVARKGAPHPSGATIMSTVGAGEVVALDAALAEVRRLDVEDLVVKHRLDEALKTRALRTVFDPRGWAFAVRCADRIADFGVGDDEDGRDRTGEAWSSYGCETAKRFSSARYHPTNGDLVFVEEGAGVRTAHASLEWKDVAAYDAVIDDERIAAIGPKFLYAYDRAAGAEAFRAPVGPGYSVCLLPGGRTAVLAGKKARLLVFSPTGEQQLALVAAMPLTARLEVSSDGIIALVERDRVAFVDPATARVAALPGYDAPVDATDQTRPGQFAWLDDHRAAVVWPGTANLSVIDLGDIFTALPAQKWKVEKSK